MFKLTRSAVALIPVLAAVVVAAVALSSTASGSAALRFAAGRLGVTAYAAGGGGSGGGIDQLTISRAELTAKVAVNVTVTYMCQPVFDPNTGQLDVFFFSSSFATLQEKTGKTVANGSGFGSGTAICDEGLTSTPTVNQLTMLVTPYVFPASGPFKNGTALATVEVFACPNVFVASGVPPPCDFGSLINTIISIK